MKEGEKVRVRLHTGEVVEAVYDEPVNSTAYRKTHFVDYGNMLLIAGKDKHFADCRFVGPCAVAVPSGARA